MLPIHIRSLDDFNRHVIFGSTPESVGLEFKQAYNASSQEIRKDVLAMANTWGGTILVGVSEASNTQGEKVASGLLPQQNIEELKKRINDALASKVFPAVRVETYSINVPQGDGTASTSILAVCVFPLADGLAAYQGEPDIGALRFPYRDNFGVKFFTPAEVTKRMDSRSRRMIIRARELGLQCGSNVRIASAVAMQRLEHDEERETRLRAQGVRVAFVGSRPSRLQSVVIEVPFIARNVVVSELSADFPEQLSLKIPAEGALPVVDVPFGAVRELWRAGTEIGLALDCEIALVVVGDHVDAFLRYPGR